MEVYVIDVNELCCLSCDSSFIYNNDNIKLIIEPRYKSQASVSL